MRLSTLAQGRENNFHLLRLIASLAVLVSHCFVLFSGDPHSEPWVQRLGITPGSLAVDVFFVTSGFLVTASLLRSQSALDFIIGRVCRIYPGLWVMTLISVGLIGLHFTEWPIGPYLRDAQTLTFLVKDLTVIGGVTGSLPGVFGGLPYPSVINGSLWTLPWEVKMYAGLLLLWCALMLATRVLRLAVPGLGGKKLLGVAVALVVALSLYKHFSTWWPSGAVDERFRLAYMFFSGALYQLLKDRVHMHRWAVTGALALVLLATLQPRLFFVAYQLLLPYIVLGLAYLPKGRILAFNRLGDYSYGLYIYAFPLQQSILALAPSITLLNFMAASIAATGLAAIASWHGVEQPLISAGNRLRARWCRPAP